MPLLFFCLFYYILYFFWILFTTFKSGLGVATTTQPKPRTKHKASVTATELKRIVEIADSTYTSWSREVWYRRFVPRPRCAFQESTWKHRWKSPYLANFETTPGIYLISKIVVGKS